MTDKLAIDHLPNDYFDQPQPASGGFIWHRPAQYLHHDPDGLDPEGLGQAPTGGEPLTTKEGRSRFVTHQPAPPPPAARDNSRIDYLSELAMVNTPTISEVISCARRLVLLNRRQVYTRRGLVVTGMAGTEKTTAITALGRTHELAARRHQGRSFRRRLPVFYVTVPPAATPKMLAAEFTRFLGLPLPPRSNITDVVNAVCLTTVRVGWS